MSEKNVHVSAQVTPNPHTLKFMIDPPIQDSGIYNFTTKEEAQGSELPESLFEIDGIDGVMVGTNFVSVTKTNKFDWADLAEPIIETLKGVIGTKTNLIDTEKASTHQKSEDTEEILKIKNILDGEIRPAVAMDGGDITFHSYEDGILTLYLQGACQSCPSATLTLKMGIENRLKEEIPGLKEVVQL